MIRSIYEILVYPDGSRVQFIVEIDVVKLANSGAGRRARKSKKGLSVLAEGGVVIRANKVTP